MSPIEFERLLSFRPKVASLAGHSEEAPTVRDMAFDFYCGKYKDTDRANEATKQWTDALYERFSKA